MTTLKGVVDATLADGRFDLREAKKVTEATGPTLSGTEAKTLGDLYERLTRPSGAQAPVQSTTTAIRHLDSVFAAKNVPLGSNRERMRQDLAVRLENVDRASKKLSKAPSTNSLVSVTLTDRRPAHGARETAYVNPLNQKAYLRTDGVGKSQWFGPFDLSASPSDRTVPLAPNQLTPERFNWIRAAMVDDLATTTFTERALPSTGRFVDLGVLHGLPDGTTYRVLVPEQASLDASTKYVVRREKDLAADYSPLLSLTSFEDPATDGKVSAGMRQRARNVYYHNEFAEIQGWHAGAPPSSVKLARTGIVTGVDGYLVRGQDAGGQLLDPDTATQVYFRLRQSGQWAGPFAIEPLYPS